MFGRLSQQVSFARSATTTESSLREPGRRRAWRCAGAIAAAAILTSGLAFSPTRAVAAGNNALQFDGTNDYVTFGVAPTLGASTFTLETWFKWTGSGVTTTTGTGGATTAIPLLTKGRGESENSNVDMNYFLGIQGGKLAADYEEGAGQTSPGLNHPAFGTTAITTTAWHHAAVTFDGTTLTLYLDGVADGSTVVGSGRLPRSDSIQHAAIGSALTSTGAAAGYFGGMIDEARVWNVARTGPQIQSTMGVQIAPQVGLLGAWHLNEGTGTTTANSASIGNNGTLTNGPTWVNGFPLPLTVAPAAPALSAPANDATGIITPPTLDVVASDPDGGLVDVSFYGRPLASGLFALIGAQSEVVSGAHAAMAWPNLGGGQTYEWYATVSDGSQSTTGATWTFHTAAQAGTVLIGVGDTASCASTGDEATAAIMAGLDGNIFTTGDNVYQTGTAAEFADCYDPSWGPFLSRTRPTTGNHDWGNTTPGSLAGYFGYFGAQATDAGGNSYYSYDADANWHVVNLESECANIPGGCAVGSPQYNWLVADLAANSTKNVMAVWHKPRFSSGVTNLVEMQPLLDVMYAAGVDLAFVGHDHIYERFQPLDAGGDVDLAYGIRHFTIGTGGESYHAAGAQLATSAVLKTQTYGLVKLVLHPTGYEWKFLSVAGDAFSDSGAGTVHGAPVQGESGLDLGSGGAYVTFGDPAELDLATFTIETWFKRTGAGVSGTTGTGGILNFIPLVTHGAPQAEGSNIDANWLLGINDASDVLAADFEDTATGLNHPVSGTTVITNDVWHHAAATYDGTTWRLYLDGTLDATELESAAPRSDSIQRSGLGVMLNSSGDPANTARFQGVLDEARVWASARSLTEIRSGINQIPTPATGLVARWAMNESAGIVLDDAVAPDSDGTITGAGTSWVAGAPFGMPIVSAGADQSAVRPATGLLDGFAIDDGLPSALTLAWTQVSGPDTAAIAAPSSATTSVSFASSGTGTYEFRLTASDGTNTRFDDVTVTVTDSGVEANWGIDFDGADDFVTFGTNASLGLPQFTLETWFRRDGAGVVSDTGTNGVKAIPLITKGRAEQDASPVDMNYFLGIDGTTGQLVADFEEGAAGVTPGLNHPISGTTVIQNGIWYHAAATYDGSTWRLYLNGIPDGAPLFVGQPVRFDSTQHAGLAAAMNSSGAVVGYFNGVLDEARIWDHARTQPQIRSAMSGPITTAPGLVARWGANEGTGTRVASSAGGTVTGTLTNGPVWVTGTPFLSGATGLPDTPSNVAPAPGATEVSTNPTLSVDVSTPNAGPLVTEFYGRQVGANTGTPFTFVVLPDTQVYTTSDAAAAIFRQQTQWIADNTDALNVVFVSHLGDLTEHTDTVEAEFVRADSAMDILDTAGIPNNITPGNHDLGTGATTSNYFDTYFSPSRYALPGNTWYGGWLGEEPGQVQRFNKDNYELFTSSGIDFLIVHLEVDPPTDAVQWAQTIIDRFPDRQVIISTHAFVTTSNARGTSKVTTRSDGLTAEQVWTQLVAPNCNVFMVVNGHYPGEGRTTTANSCGQPVYQMLTDYQSRANGGDGWLRYYTFTPSTNTIDAFTYSPRLGTFETDANSQFSLPYAMDAAGSFEFIGSTTTPSGATASLQWPGRTAGAQYEWYAVTDNGVATAPSATWGFSVAAPVNHAPSVTNPGAQTTAENSTVDLPIAATDADGDTLTYSASGLPASLAINAATGHITGTVAYTAAPGPYSVAVTVSDGKAPAVESSFSWTVTNTNREPVFDQNLLDRTSAEAAIVSLSAAATDPDGDALVYAANGLPTGLSINSTSGLISGTIADTAASGSPYSVMVTVRDGAVVDATDTFTWTITNTNREPVFDQNLGDQSTAEAEVVLLSAAATDPDGDPLTYAAVGLPAGLSINTATGLVAGTVSYDAAVGSPYSVMVTVRDGAVVDATDTFTWTITNTNREPVFNMRLVDRNDLEGTLVSIDATATDPDGDSLTYGATGLPVGLSLNSSTGVISGTIASATHINSPYRVSITVRDGATVDAANAFTWTVTAVESNPPPPPPRYVALTPARLVETRVGQPATIDGQYSAIGTRQAGTVSEVLIAGRAGIPADATAVVLNIAAINPVRNGYLTVWACDADRPTASNLNYTVGQTIANLVITKLSASGTICIYTPADTNLIIDAIGYHP